LPLTILLLNYLRIGKKAVYFLAALFIGGFLIRYASWHYLIEPNLLSDNFGALFNKIIYYPTYNRLDGLLVGVGIAGLYTFYPHIKDSINKYSNILMVLGIITLTGAYFICTPQQTFNTCIVGYPLIAIGYGFIVAAIVCPGNVFFSVKSWLTSQIATLSYGIYLIHKLMIHVTQTLLGKAGVNVNSNLMMLCCLASTVAGALVLRYTIEKPSLKLRDKVLGRKQ
jgi:peptidoglycan/LPS O-acetylase OafA/YrhL